MLRQRLDRARAQLPGVLDGGGDARRRVGGGPKAAEHQGQRIARRGPAFLGGDRDDLAALEAAREALGDELGQRPIGPLERPRDSGGEQEALPSSPRRELFSDLAGSEAPRSAVARAGRSLRPDSRTAVAARRGSR